MKTKLSIILASVALLFACTENTEIPVNQENLLLGNWINPTYTDTKITFEKTNNLREDSYGISFKENNVFIERSSGWCGTPPLTFFDYEGTFEVKDSIISISTQNFSGAYRWRILTLDTQKLVVNRESSE